MKKVLLGCILALVFCAQAFAGSITGTIKFNGTAPEPRTIHMDADPICYAVNKGNVHSSALLLGDGNTLGNVFVYIKSGLSKTDYPAPSTDAIINQGGCNYTPHVLGVRQGQKVKFLNPDGTLHNVHAMCQVNPEFNASMPDFRKEMEVTFNKPEFMFQIECDVHPWMKMWMAVMPHPFFAVTGPDGQFQLKDVPDGTYVIEAWHEKLGTMDVTVTVKGDASQKTDFAFTQPK